MLLGYEPARGICSQCGKERKCRDCHLNKKRCSSEHCCCNEYDVVIRDEEYMQNLNLVNDSQAGQIQGAQEQNLQQRHGDQGGQSQGDQIQDQTIGDQQQSIGDTAQQQTIGDSELNQTIGESRQNQYLGGTEQSQGDQDISTVQTQGDVTTNAGDQGQNVASGNQNQDLTTTAVQAGSSVNTGEQTQDLTTAPVQAGSSVNTGEQTQDLTTAPVQAGSSVNTGEQTQDLTTAPVQAGSSVNTGEQTQDLTTAPVQAGSSVDTGAQLQDLTSSPTQGDSAVTTGDQSQSVTSGNQTLSGPEYTVTYGDQSSGGPTMSPTYGNQILGGQSVQGHTNISPLNNNQTITTSVSGVTVNVTTNCGCNQSPKGRSENCDDCCTDAICPLLANLASIQAQYPTETIDLYPKFQTSSSGTDQIITSIEDCETITFENVGNPPLGPTKVFRLNQLSGFRVDFESPHLFEFVAQYSSTCFLTNASTTGPSCEDCCDTVLSRELEQSRRLLRRVSLFVEGTIAQLDFLYVINICQCLVILADNLNRPTTYYVFPICSINGYVTN